MRPSSWIASPDDLGAFDATVVRCIAGEFDENFLVRATKTSGVDTRRRMATLISKHCQMNIDELQGMGAIQRQRMANDIVLAEMDERETMPGILVPLRTLNPRG